LAAFTIGMTMTMGWRLDAMSLLRCANGVQAFESHVNYEIHQQGQSHG